MDDSTTTPAVTLTTGPTPDPILKIPSFWKSDAGVIVFSGLVVIFIIILVSIV